VVYNSIQRYADAITKR